MDHNRIDQRQPLYVGMAVIGMLLLALGIVGGGFVRPMSDGAGSGPPESAPAGLQWEHRGGRWVLVDATRSDNRVWAGDNDVVPLALVLRPANVALGAGAIVFLLAMIWGAGQLGHKEVEPVAVKKASTPSPAEPRSDVPLVDIPHQPSIALTRTPPGARNRTATPPPVRPRPPDAAS